jgi:hypothetical protein
MSMEITLKALEELKTGCHNRACNGCVCQKINSCEALNTHARLHPDLNDRARMLTRNEKVAEYVKYMSSILKKIELWKNLK